MSCKRIYVNGRDVRISDRFICLCGTGDYDAIDKEEILSLALLGLAVLAINKESGDRYREEYFYIPSDLNKEMVDRVIEGLDLENS